MSGEPPHPIAPAEIVLRSRQAGRALAGAAAQHAVAERRRIVGFDVVELAPMPGNVAPDFLAAKLVYKLLGYTFLLGPRAERA